MRGPSSAMAMVCSEWAVRAERFRADVQEAAIGPDHDIPHLSAHLIGKYIADLHQLGLLD
jgi:fatty acid CoA ligase FadD9